MITAVFRKTSEKTKTRRPLVLTGQIFAVFLIAVIVFIPFGWAQNGETLAIEIRGTINPATSQFLSRAIAEAQNSGSQLLLVELDTPGGLVSSVREMAQSIDQSPVPVVVYTTPAGASATSAGALLMISSHLAAMAPGTNIGAAHPVGSQGDDIKGDMGKKAVNDVAAFARSMAELRKRNASVAAEVVTLSKSYSAEEAQELRLIDLIASDKNQLMQQIHGRLIKTKSLEKAFNTQPFGGFRKLEMSLGETVLHRLSHPNVAAILMSLAILLIYAEMSTPGLGFAGILGGICLLVAFVAFQAIPIKTGGLILLVAGVGLIFAEAFVTTHGFMAAGGSIAFLLGLLWGIDPEASNLRVHPTVLGSIGIVLLGGSLLVGWGVSRTRSLTEKAMKDVGGGGPVGVNGYSAEVIETDKDGRTGQILVRGEIWKFACQEPVRKGDRVFVQQADGLTLKVKKETT